MKKQPLEVEGKNLFAVTAACKALGLTRADIAHAYEVDYDTVVLPESPPLFEYTYTRREIHLQHYTNGFALAYVPEQKVLFYRRLTQKQEA